MVSSYSITASSGVLEFDYVSTTRPPNADEDPITPAELEQLFHKLGLNPRRRLPNAKAIFKLLELQIAVTKYYFTVNNLLTIMDCFMQDDVTQVGIASSISSSICRYCRNNLSLMGHINKFPLSY
jgi:hypothetical protein